MRYFYYYPRPFVIFQDVNQLLLHEQTGSFPSGHASFYFALAMGVYLYNKKLGKIYFILAFLISFARVFAGIHWPFDIAGGLAVGVGITLGFVSPI